MEAGCGHRWAAAESGAGVPETPVIAPVTPRSRDPGAASAPREKPTLLFSASASLAVAAPRLRSAGNFPPKVILRAGRRGVRSAHVLAIDGGGRGASSLLRRSGAGRRPRALPELLSRAGSSAPAGRRFVSARSPEGVSIRTQASGGDSSVLPSPHPQVSAATRAPAVPGRVVGCRHGNRWCPDGAGPGWGTWH